MRRLPSTQTARPLARRTLLLKLGAAGLAATTARMLLPAAHHRIIPPALAAQPVAQTPAYALRGPQVEPEASFWTLAPAPLPTLPRMEDVIRQTDNPAAGAYLPPYPSDEVTAREVEELHALAALRDDAAAVAGEGRAPVSRFIQLRPQPISAVYDKVRHESTPVIRTGRELARYFEGETPGLVHRLALEHLLRDQNWSPPRQARMWMALDLAIYGALTAAWHYKWYSDRTRVGYRPRPVEVDTGLSVLYDRVLDRTGAVERATRVFPLPSPGTPRHPAYPSGHSVVGGAGSEVLAYFFPGERAELEYLADNCGMARLWAGVHYRSDHLQGMALGRHIGRLIIDQLEAGCVQPARTLCAIEPETERQLVQNRGLPDGAGSTGTHCDLPPSRELLLQSAAAFSRCAAGG